MARLLLTDEEWDLIKDEFPKPKRTGRPRRDSRQIMDAIFWILRTGSPWRDLPDEFGPWQTAWRLFDRWNGDGTLDRLLRKLQSAFVDAGEIDSERWYIDGTIVRAARCAGGGGKKTTHESLLITH
jgi:transposase